jgi:hypothetical protein
VASGKTEWLVYSRADCSLCDKLLMELAQTLGPETAGQVQVVDVDSSPALAEKYGGRVPVLLANGEFLCAYRLDQERLAAYL